jgi:hypothetical protein
VYLAYPAGDADIFRPDFWMHQIFSPAAPRLDPVTFRETVEGLLARAQ